VESGKSRIFQYVKLEKGGRRYFCVDQSVFVLAWILFFKNDAMRPIIVSDTQSFSLRLVVRWLRNNYRSLRRNLMFLGNFICFKFRFKSPNTAIKLPIYGHLCAPVHKGYKVFDVLGGVVRKVFDHDVNTSVIADEIERLKAVSEFDFAPRLRRWNIAARWYEEEYLRGSTDNPQIPPDSSAVLKKFRRELIQHLNRLTLVQQPVAKPAIDYIAEIMHVLKIDGLANVSSTRSEFFKTKPFLDSMVERLSAEVNCSIVLVFTHGDFIPDNMVITRRGIRLIDWEGAGYRSALFDFYSFFFYRAVCKDVPINTVASEINQALSFFISQLPRKDPDISASLIRLENVYRWVYYIEQLCGDLKRMLTDRNLNIGEFISRDIDAFCQYEDIFLSNKQVNVKDQSNASNYSRADWAPSARRDYGS
jgi:Phosphotransferase enzyme family